MTSAPRRQIIDRETAQSLRAMVDMGKARVVKEHGDSESHLAVYAPSGRMIGIVGEQYRYLFEAALVEHGSGDGLFDGCSQTTRAGNV